MAELIALATQYRGTFLLVFFRLGGLLAVAPVLGHRAVPVPHRVGLAALLAMLLAPVLGPAAGSGAGTGLDLVGAIAGEVFLGVLIGAVAGLVLAAVQMAGELVGVQMGLGIAGVFDPAMGQQVSVVARWQETLALLLLVATNAHHALVQAAALSFQRIPPGALADAASAAGSVVALGAKLFRAGLEVAAPVVGILFVLNVVLALLARVAPQMQVFTVAAPLTVAVGVFGLIEALPHLAALVARLTAELGADLTAVLLAGRSRGF
jgi:flagellar biosynthetic protein FliR